MPDSELLTVLAWLCIAAAMTGAVAVVFGPHVLDALDHAARAFIRWRDRTEPERLARRAREARHG